MPRDTWARAAGAYIDAVADADEADALWLTMLRILAEARDRVPPVDGSWVLTQDMTPAEALAGMQAELERAIDVQMRGRGPEAHAAHLRSQKRFEKRIAAAKEGEAADVPKAVDEAMDELMATSEMIEALDDPSWMDHPPRDVDS